MAAGAAGGVAMILIRIADADAASMDGQFLAEYDPARPGLSPDGEELIAHIAVARAALCQRLRSLPLLRSIARHARGRRAQPAADRVLD